MKDEITERIIKACKCLQEHEYKGKTFPDMFRERCGVYTENGLNDTEVLCMEISLLWEAYESLAKKVLK